MIYVLGRILLDKEEFDPAKTYFEQALEIYKELDNEKDIALTLNNLGRVYDEKEDVKKAIEFYKDALDILIRLGLKDDRLTEIVRNNLESLED